MKLITTRKFMLGLLIALLCVTLIATASITISGYAVPISSEELLASANAAGYPKCNHEWAHGDATVLSQEGGQLSSGRNYYLGADLTLSNNLSIGGSVELCLNGHVLTGTGEGSVVSVEIGASFVLYDCNKNNTGKITGGSALSGGGVNVKYGEFVMNGGKISDNVATTNGGGVYVDGGAFVMNGGTIEQNVAHYGGGVSVTTGSMDMDTVISQVNGKARATSIEYGSFTINNGIICNNMADENGSGGGVYYTAKGCKFTMNNGQIYGNTAVTGEGGGIWADTLSTGVITGGLITANTASTGDGVMVRGHGNREESVNRFNLGGKPVIFANGSSNVYLSFDSMITIISQFEEGALVGVRCGPGNDGIFTVNWSEYNEDSVLDFFTSDQTSTNIVESEGEAMMCSGHRHVDTDVEGFVRLDSPRTIIESQRYYLEKDLTGNLIIDADVELCLNGCKLIGDGKGPVIMVNKGAKFTLHDCNIHANGTVTGGVAEQGAGVYVGGTFVMNGGVITGNVASVANAEHSLVGGGVYVSNGGSAFTMNGGTITGNTAEFYGGGVYVDNGSTFTMNGGTISSNSATDKIGDGVYLNGATFTMTGGVITNHADYGVYVYNNPTVKSTVQMSGMPVVSGNKTANVYLYRDVDAEYSSAVGASLAIKVVGAMVEGANVGVTIVYDTTVKDDASEIIATGWSDQYEHPMQYFFSDISGKCIGVKGTNLTLEKHRYELISNFNEHYNECPNCKEVIQYKAHVWDEMTNYVRDDSETHQKECPVCHQKEGVKRTHVVTVASVSALDSTKHIGTCDDCREVGVIKDHTLETTHVDPTCTENGLHKVFCTICEAVPVNDTLKALGHTSDGGKVTKQATCTEDGVLTYTCTVCEDEIGTDAIDAFGHTSDGGKVTLAATCTEDGVFTYTCLTCEDAFDTEVIPMLGHAMDNGEVTTAPTCISTGVMTYSCVNKCGLVYKTEEMSKISHDWNEGVVTKEPTVEFDGVLTYTCRYCQATKRSNIPALEDAPNDNTPVRNGLSDEQRYKIFWSSMLLLTVIVCSVTTIVVVIKKRK